MYKYDGMSVEEMSGHFNCVPKSRKTKLRPMELKDIPWLVLATELYVPELPQYVGITVEPERVDFLLRNNINNSGYLQCWVLVDANDLPVGGGGGFCTIGTFTTKPITNDIFLFVLPNWRSLENVNKLITTYVAWAKARGAIIIQASQTGGYELELMDKLMQRNGFTNVGPNYHYRSK